MKILENFMVKLKTKLDNLWIQTTPNLGTVAKYFFLSFLFVGTTNMVIRRIEIFSASGSLRAKSPETLLDINPSGFEGPKLFLFGFYLSFLIIPIVEEFSLRMPLRPSKLGASFFLALPISILLIAGAAIVYMSFFQLSFPAFVCAEFIYVLLFFALANQINKSENRNIRVSRVMLCRSIKKHRWVSFFVFPALFALLHLGNAPVIGTSFLALCGYILPLFFMGLAMNVLRLRLGISYSILFHLLINSLVIGVRLISLT